MTAAEHVSIYAIPGRLVARDEDAGIIVAWNESATFNVYGELAPGVFHEVDVFTVYGVEGEGEARGHALDWLAETVETA